jgi:hypothetical protein
MVREEGTHTSRYFKKNCIQHSLRCCNSIMSSRTLTSVIWTYFTIDRLDKTKAVCTVNNCNKLISRGLKTFNTTNIANHLEKEHPTEFRAFQAKTNDEKTRKRTHTTDSPGPSAACSTPTRSTCFSPSGPSTPRSVLVSAPRQLTLEGAIDRVTKWKPDDLRAASWNKAVGEFIAVGSQAFSVVEDDSFRRLIAKAEPRYQLPHRNFFSSKLIPEMYEKVQARIKVIIGAEATDLSLTSDEWSDPMSGLSLLSMTGHWLTPEFKRRQAVLYTSELHGSHTGEYMGSKLEEMLTGMDIPHSKVHVLLRDNGANMVKALKVAGLESVGCFAHTLQLVISKPIMSQRAVIDVLAICRALCTRFRHSIQAQERLKELQALMKKPQKKLQQDVSTRWNSSYHMLLSVLEQREVLAIYLAGLSSDDKKGIKLDDNQWTLVENVVDTLGNVDVKTY